MSIFDNREKELIEQETEEALQRASDEYQKELDEAEDGKIYVNNIPKNCLDCPNIGCRRGNKANSDDIKKEFTTKRPKNCPLHSTSEITNKENTILKIALEMACEMLYEADSHYHSKPKQAGVKTLVHLLTRQAENINKMLNEKGEK